MSGGCGGGSKKTGMGAGNYTPKQGNPFMMPKTSGKTGGSVLNGASAFGTPKVRMSFSKKK